MIVYGKVESINRVDIDKSGQNPKYTVSISLNPTKIEESEAALNTDRLLIFQGREVDILEQIERLPEVGETIVIESRVSENNPRTLPLLKIQFQDS